MPTCSSCGSAFLDGEAHACVRPAARTASTFLPHFLATLTALVVAGGLAIGAFVVYTKATAAPPIAVNRAKLEPLYRSAKTIQAAIGVGLNVPRYAELLQGVATEVAIAGDRATTEKEKAIVTAYAAAVMTLHDAQTLWTKRNENSDGGGFVRIEGEAARLVEKYNVPTDKKYGIYGDEGIQAIWARAGEQINAATKLYFE
jgi:hypothetical protein